jgi:hypothetical protein
VIAPRVELSTEGVSKFVVLGATIERGALSAAKCCVRKMPPYSALRSSVAAVVERLSARHGRWSACAVAPKRAFPTCTKLRIGIADVMKARPLFPNVEDVEVVVDGWDDLLKFEMAVRDAYRPARVRFTWDEKKAEK